MSDHAGTVAVFTLTNDLHALVIQRTLHSLGARCHVVETTNLFERGGISWETCHHDHRGAKTALLSRAGEWFDLHRVDTVWWRRVNSDLILPAALEDRATRDLLNNDWKASLWGALLTDFKGTWVNDPWATRVAENKLVQLRAASESGFRVPHTLVSQDPAAVRAFVAELGGTVVVKPVRGTNLLQLAAVSVRTLGDLEDSQIRMCPAMYQECVTGDVHLRVNCFGETLAAIRILSTAFDWRRDLTCPFETLDLDPEVVDRIRATLDHLGLRMGIVDLKVTRSEEVVWLEVNPQGQFLFLEPLAGVDLTTPFARFLMNEGSGVRDSRPPRSGARSARRPASL